jgi:hypothetical protein
MAITTAMATSFKQELFSAGHCFNGTVTPVATAASAATSFTAVSPMTGLAVGMAVTGANIGSPCYITAISSANTMTVSAPTTNTITGATITASGDVFKMALIKPSMSGAYGAANVNYTDIVTASDEITNLSGSAYVAAGQALTNVTAATGSTVAFISFSNPSWTSASFSTAGCMIYNSTVRDGGVSGTNSTGGGRCCSVHDFGGPQQVNNGTFTVLMPTANSSTAILRIA